MHNHQGDSPKGKESCPKTLASELFSSLQCKDLLPRQVPIYIPAKANVQEACSILIKNHLDFAPVESSDNLQPFTGVFTLRSLCKYIVQNHSKQATKKLKRSSSMLNMSEFDLRQLVCAFVGPDKPAIDYSGVDDFVHFADTDLVSSATDCFCKGSEQASVVNESGGFVGVLTQAMVLKHFIDSCGNLDTIFRETIFELFPSCCKKPVKHITEKETVLSALNILSETNERAVAVTSESGSLIGSISLEDIKELFRSKQQKLLFSEVRHFTVYVRSQSTTEYGLAAVHGHSKVSHAIQKMMNTKLLRVWIVDSQNKPTGVLTVGDVANYLCSM